MGGLIELISDIRKYLEEILGLKGSTVLFQNAGRELGKEIGETLREERIDRYLEKVGEFMRESKVGILIPEEVSQNRIILSIDECITCSGMRSIGRRICHFETGIVAGLLETFLNRRVKVQETKCNAMGEGICQVTVEV